MAERRMFSKSLTERDQFREMSVRAQNLYFHLNLQADDDGFVDCVRGLMRCIRATQKDLQQLIDKGYIILFPSGIAVIVHWKAHNCIAKDRYHKTIYTKELSMLRVNENDMYVLADTECQQSDDTCDTDCTPSIGKVREGKEREKETQKESSAVEQIVSCLNEKAGTAFRASTRQTRKHIHARLAEGYSPQDFEAVIAYKVSKWKDDPRMQGYLRPETLFGAKFEGYLQEARQQTAVYQNIVPDTGLLDEWGVQ